MVSRRYYKRAVFSAVSPMHKVPAELLAEIFCYVRNDSVASASSKPTSLATSALSWLAVTHVCAFWRSVAQCWPTLWTTPTLDAPRHHVNLQLSNSSSAPLDLTLNLSSPLPIWLVILLRTHLSHTHALNLSGSPSALYTLLTELNAPAPILTRLSIKPTHYLFAELPLVLPANLLANSTPALRDLALRCCVMRPDSQRALLGGLRALRVEFPAPLSSPSSSSPPPSSRGTRPPRAPFVSFSDFRAAMELMPELETLSLVHCLPHDDVDVDGGCGDNGSGRSGIKEVHEHRISKLRSVTLRGPEEDERRLRLLVGVDE